MALFDSTHNERPAVPFDTVEGCWETDAKPHRAGSALASSSLRDPPEFAPPAGKAVKSNIAVVVGGALRIGTCATRVHRTKDRMNFARI